MISYLALLAVCGLVCVIIVVSQYYEVNGKKGGGK